MSPRPFPLLSKSRFLAGLQCDKRLYLECYERELAAPPDEAQEAIFATGTAVGVLARALHPGGVLVDEDHLHHDEAVERTRALLDRAQVSAIFEAAFTEDGVRVRVDILARGAAGRWRLIEVKSSASVKPQHVDDAAIQLATLERAGLPIEGVSIAHIDRGYVYPGGVYRPERLFALADVTEETQARLADVPGELAAMRDTLGRDSRPEIEIGPHCSRPYRCQFFDFCRVDRPAWSIEELPGMRGPRVQALMEAGIESIADLPDDERLSALQRRVREAVRSGRPYVGADLGAALDGIAAPAHFIDVETVAPALPVYPGTRPFEVRPFQWSDHVLHEDGSVTHAEFLAAGDEDPMREFAESLVEQLAGAATVVVYSGYEEVRLRELAEALPELRRGLDRVLVIPRVDLLQVIRSHYYHPEFRGSFSLKSVLPVLVPELGYDDLAVHDGTLATLAFLETLRDDTSSGRREQLRADLLAYCRRDTEAMVRIVEALRSAAESR